MKMVSDGAEAQGEAPSQETAVPGSEKKPQGRGQDRQSGRNEGGQGGRGWYL